MIAAVLKQRAAPVVVATAGTLAVEDQPISQRTQWAMNQLGVIVGSHRSRQLAAEQLAQADLVVCAATEHVRYIRRMFPTSAGKAATLSWLANHLEPGAAKLSARVAALNLATIDLARQMDIPDPAGGDDADCLSCARAIEHHASILAKKLGCGRVRTGTQEGALTEWR